MSKEVWIKAGEYECGCGSTMSLEVRNRTKRTMSISGVSVRCGACHVSIMFSETAAGDQFRISVSERTRIAMKPAGKVGSIDE